MPFNIWDSATNTETVRRMVTTAMEDENLVGPTIAPLVSVVDRKVKRGSIEIEAFGMGQMKARGATPPIFIPRIAFDESYIELANLDEMTPLEEDEWHDLTGTNEYAKLRAGVAVLERARILQIRNERRTEWMRWKAFFDEFEVSLADEPGQTYKVKYGLPGNHRPQVAIDWRTAATAKGVTDVRAWQKLIQTELGFWGTNIYMGADTWESWQYQKEVADLLKPNSTGEYTIPSPQQVENLLYGGSVDRPRAGQEPVTVTITNAGYRDVGQGTNRGTSAMTYYLPEGYVMITTRPSIGGERIADMPDGRVAVATNGAPPIVWKQGMQSETLVDVRSHTHYFRQASARIPRINIPRAFVIAKVWLS